MNKYYQTFVDEDGTYVKIENKQDYIKYLQRKLTKLFIQDRKEINALSRIIKRILKYRTPWYKSLFFGNKELKDMVEYHEFLLKNKQELTNKIQSTVDELVEVINDEV